MRARTGLWEPRVGNDPGPPGLSVVASAGIWIAKLVDTEFIRSVEQLDWKRRIVHNDHSSVNQPSDFVVSNVVVS